MKDIDKIAHYAQKCYNDANCEYGDNENYFIHINMVVNAVKAYRNVFKDGFDFIDTLGAAYCHDLMEDAKQTYNNICTITGSAIADVVLAVTDVPA